MKHFISLALLLALTTSIRTAHAGEQEVRKCEFNLKAGCRAGGASVTLADGIVTNLEVFVFWCGLPGRPGYTCSIESSRSNPEDSKWTDEAGATLITHPDPYYGPDAPDEVRVTVGRHVSIDMDRTQSPSRCGAGAELPRAIVIPGRGKTCRVWFSEP